ncbi:MAG: hypothetical protein WCC11_01885 [Gammaproteobacteria bacterium]
MIVLMVAAYDAAPTQKSGEISVGAATFAATSFQPQLFDAIAQLPEAHAEQFGDHERKSVTEAEISTG